MENANVQTEHLLEVIKAYVRDVGLVNHQLESFNELVTGNGIKHVL
jgi:DNA-directed RNA polymerase beta subunit